MATIGLVFTKYRGLKIDVVKKLQKKGVLLIQEHYLLSLVRQRSLNIMYVVSLN